MIRFAPIKRHAIKIVVGAIVAVASTVIGGMIIYEYTKPTPKLQLIIDQSAEEFGGNRVRQTIT